MKENDIVYCTRQMWKGKKLPITKGKSYRIIMLYNHIKAILIYDDNNEGHVLKMKNFITEAEYRQKHRQKQINKLLRTKKCLN